MCASESLLKHQVKRAFSTKKTSLKALNIDCKYNSLLKLWGKPSNLSHFSRKKWPFYLGNHSRIFFLKKKRHRGDEVCDGPAQTRSLDMQSWVSRSREEAPPPPMPHFLAKDKTAVSMAARATQTDPDRNKGSRRLSALYKTHLHHGRKEISEHMLPWDQVCRMYGVNKDRGLSEEDDVPKLREQHGYNEIALLEGPSPWEHWMEQLKATFFGGFILIMWAGASICFIAYATNTKKDGTGKNNDYLYLGITIISVIMVSSLFTLYHLENSHAITLRFKQMVPPKANVIRDGVHRQVLSRELVPGDIVTVIKGDRIPADLRIIQASSFIVDESKLPEQSDKCFKNDHVSGDGIFDSPNLAFGTTMAMSGR
jgi:hypothetical protein